MTASAPTTPTVDASFPIEAAGRVRLLAGACIALRAGPDACHACRDVCPAQSLAATPSGWSVGTSCLGCGHCAAACPSGALTIEGFDLQEPLPPGNVVRVECWKVPNSVAGPSALRVPCLGGLTLTQWLTIAEAAGNRRVVAVDHGWCSQCAAATRCAPAHPAEHALTQAQAILAETGWPDVRRPRLEGDPLPASQMPLDIPVPRPDSPTRRAFFRHLGNEARRATGLREPAGEPTPRRLKRHGLLLPGRERLLAVVQRLADAAGRPPAATPFSALAVAPHCNDLGVCAGVCPTGALARYATGPDSGPEAGTAGLEFNPWRCIACGQCVKSCPEHALTLSAAPAAPTAQAAQRLTVQVARTCPTCLQGFHGPPGAEDCPACRRKRQLGTALFGAMFADRKV